MGGTRYFVVLLTGASSSSLLGQASAVLLPPTPSNHAAANSEPVASRQPDIIVTGPRLRGEAIGDVAPDVRLNENDIRAFGTFTIGELIDALAPQTRSSRSDGPPVTLLNGRRIGSFLEIASLPSEAIERIDILPEEVALSYGYRADQRVVNIVLKEHFRAVATSTSLSGPTAGGRSTEDASMGVTRISRSGRWSLNGQYQRSGDLLESERSLNQATPALPFDVIGNIGASPYLLGAEIDPALSAAARAPVTIAGVPRSATSRALQITDFLSGANVPNVTDVGRYRSLLPRTESAILNGTFDRPLFGDVSLTVNARVGATSNESLLGLPSLNLTVPRSDPFSPFSSDISLFRYAAAGGPLRQRSAGSNAHAGLALEGGLFSWNWNLTANYDLAHSVTHIDTNADAAALQTRLLAGDPSFNPFGPIDAGLLVMQPGDRTESTSQSGSALILFNGPLLRLPAGMATTALAAGFDWRSLDSGAMRNGVTDTRALNQDNAAIRGSLNFPIANRSRNVLGRLGNISLNFNFDIARNSDFGIVRTLGYGIRWQPFRQLDLTLNVTDKDEPPSVQQLLDPVLRTPNSRMFDFGRGETVDVTRIDGGNPSLAGDNRRLIVAGLTLRPARRANLIISASYTSLRVRNPIELFPLATAEIEAAFPDRFVRDPAGRLIQIDGRPINYSRSDRQDLRWGLVFSKPIRSSLLPVAQSTSGTRVEQTRGADGTGARASGDRGSISPRTTGAPLQAGSIQISLSHTWRFSDSELIRPGLPELNYLNGSAFDGRGGRPRHEIELQAGFFHSGFAASLRGAWQSGTFVRGGAVGPGASAGDLRFSSLATLNLNLVADLGGQGTSLGRSDWRRGAQLQVTITNLFDSRMRVRDANGATPIGYQPDYLDPLGRSIRVSVRKLF